MAAIMNSGGGTAASSSPIAVGGASAPAAAGTTDPTATTTDVFTQLISEMLSANAARPAQATPSSQAMPSSQATPSSPDLAAFDLTGDELELPSDDRDTDLEDSEDEDLSALSLMALLSGFPALSPQVPSGSSSTSTSAPYGAPMNATGSGAETAANAIEATLLPKSAEIDITRAALDELAPDSSDPNAPPIDTTSAATPTTQSTSTPVHTLLATHAAAARDIDVAPDATLRTPVGTPAWKDELGTQLTWMAINGREAASLRLSPDNLGPLEVRISMREGEASVYFGASNPDTRSALEQSLPRLRELFAAQGLVLADAGVSRDAPRNAFKPSPQPGATRSVSDASADVGVKSVTLARAGLIDTYV